MQEEAKFVIVDHATNRSKQKLYPANGSVTHFYTVVDELHCLTAVQIQLVPNF